MIAGRCGSSSVPREPSRVLPLLFLALAAVAAAARPFSEPDEGRYGEVAREMLESGDWLVPRQSGVLYPDKPPAVFWLMAAAMAVAGPTALAARAPALLAYAATIVLVLRAGRRGASGFGDAAALVAVSSPLLLGLAQLATLDMVLTATVTAAVLAGWRWLRTGSLAAALAAGGALGAGLLVKGPVGVLLPALVLTAAAMRAPEPRRRLVEFWGTFLLLAVPLWILEPSGFPLRSWGLAAAGPPLLWVAMLIAVAALRGPRALLSVAAIGLPIAAGCLWYLWLALRVEPSLAQFWLGRETVGRVASDVHGRGQPVYYFFALAVAATFPWLAFAAWARLRGRRPSQRHPDAWLHWVWAWVPVLFFSLPASKQPGYLAPAVPGLALWLAAWWQDRGPLPHRARVGGAWLLASAAVLALFGSSEGNRSADPLARALRETGASQWNGGQLWGWSYGLAFRLERTDLVCCGPIPPAWRFADERGLLDAPHGQEDRLRCALELLARDGDGDGAPDPAFVVVHQLEDSPHRLEELRVAARRQNIDLWLWERDRRKALVANRPRRPGDLPL